jgi:hypothetical protein
MAMDLERPIESSRAWPTSESGSVAQECYRDTDADKGSGRARTRRYAY